MLSPSGTGLDSVHLHCTVLANQELPKRQVHTFLILISLQSKLKSNISAIWLISLSFLVSEKYGPPSHKELVDFFLDAVHSEMEGLIAEN